MIPSIVLPVNGISGDVPVLPDDPSIKNTFPQENAPTEFVGNNKSHSTVILKDKSVSLSNEANSHSITNKDVEKYFKEGFTLKELLEAEDLASKHAMPISEILKLKKEGNLTFKEISTNLSQQNIITHFENLKQKFPSEYKKLENTQLSVYEQAELLSLYSDYQHININKLIENYVQYGNTAIKEVVKKEKVNKKPSKDLVERLGLKMEEAQGFSEDMLIKFEAISKKNNIPVAKVIQQFNKRAY
jgi:hypothetical protein